MYFYGDKFRWYIGTVIAVDSLAVGKVKIRIHGIHGPDITDDNLPFADVMLPSAESPNNTLRNHNMNCLLSFLRIAEA